MVVEGVTEPVFPPLFKVSMTIAEGMEIEHASVMKLVRKYVVDLEEFGLVAFQMSPRLEGQHGGNDIEYALLNQEQFTLIGTYMKCTVIARAFKKRLILVRLFRK